MEATQSPSRRCYLITPSLHLVTAYMIDLEELMPPAIYTTLADHDIVGDIVYEDHFVHFTDNCFNDEEWWRIYRERKNEPHRGQKMAYKWKNDKTACPEKYYNTMFVVHMCRQQDYDTVLDADPKSLDQHLTQVRLNPSALHDSRTRTAAKSEATT